MAPRRAHARPADAHHRRHTHGRRRSLSHRIELEGRQDEFRELADSFDTMLAQLEAHVAEQQRFAANASHELRTPLAITQTLLTSPATILGIATPGSSSNASAPSTPARSTSPRHCSCSAAPTNGLSPENTSTYPLIAEEATESSSRSQNYAA